MTWGKACVSEKQGEGEGGGRCECLCRGLEFHEVLVLGMLALKGC